MEAREYHDAYSESLEADFRELESALLSDTVKILAPNEPIKCSADTTVHAAILQMAEKRRAAVVIVDREGAAARDLHRAGSPPPGGGARARPEDDAAQRRHDARARDARARTP